MTKKNMKLAGYAVTGLFSAMMLFGGLMQLAAQDQVLAVFHRLLIDNTMTIRFLGLMKIAGAVGMWMPKGRTWAVHGFTFLFCGALVTHLGAADPAPEFIGATVGLCLLGASEWLAKQTRKSSSGSSARGRKAA